jgi:hypothetical protein
MASVSGGLLGMKACDVWTPKPRPPKYARLRSRALPQLLPIRGSIAQYGVEYRQQ